MPEDTEPVVGRKRRAGQEPEGAATEKTSATKGKAKEAEPPADKDAPSSEPRRSGRERRPRDAGVISGASRTDRSPGQTATPSSDHRTGPAKRKGATSKPSSATPGRGTRGRPSRDSDGVPVRRLGGEREAEPKEAVKPTRIKKRKNAPQGGAVAAVARKQMSPREEVAVGKRRRGRPSLDKTKSPGEGPSRPTKDSQAAAKHTEASASDLSGGTAEPKRRGRGKAVASQEHESSQQPAKRKRKAEEPRPSEPEAEEAGSESGDEQELPFRHLQETVRAIPRSTIAKWNSLDPPSVHAINAFLNDAQRPVLFRLQDTNRRREHASAALSHISRRVRTKLVKGLPFPPPTGGISARANAGSYEDEFNFERTVDAVQTLENTLNPLLHAVGLLEREIEREENALAKEYDTLHKLETNARAEAQEWKGRAKREHALARGMKSRGDSEEQDTRARVELVPLAESEVAGGLFKVCQHAWQPRAHVLTLHSPGPARRRAYRALEADRKPHGKHEEQPAADWWRCACYHQEQGRTAAGALKAPGCRTV